MDKIKAIGFDLFNTLITADNQALIDAMGRLTQSLRQSGLALELDAFKKAHREAALRFIKETRQHGKETHNRFWISAALETQGHILPPDDPIIAKAVEAYFSAFPEHIQLIPGTREMLGTLKGRYRLGLLSNFTHAPAAKAVIDSVGLTPFFDVLIISGELGYCKPHPLVFRRLIEQLGVKKGQILFVGDDPLPDITGALQAGLQPVWMTYVRDKHIPLSPSASSEAEVVDSNVPVISTWQDLFDLLDGK
jgi:putative hydrolase of the HAD superfamily